MTERPFRLRNKTPGMRQANFKLPAGLQKELGRVAEDRGMTKAALVEEAIREYLATTCDECGR